MQKQEINTREDMMDGQRVVAMEGEAVHVAVTIIRT